MSGKQYSPEPKKDLWFQWKGLSPIQRIPSGWEDSEENPLSEQLRERFKKSGHKCTWKQAGNDVFCDSDPTMRHGFMVRPNQRLVFNKGEPNIVAMGPIYRDTGGKDKKSERSDSRQSS